MNKYKLFSFLIIFSLVISLPLNALADDLIFGWARQMEGTGGINESMSVAVDSLGNVYTTGYFLNTVDFDPSGGVANLTSFGVRDIFVSKLDSSGNLVWVKQLGGVADDRGLSISVDSLGNVYTTGFFEGTADFDPSGGVANLTATGGRDIFVSKLDSSGNFAWAKQMEGTGVGNGLSITVDSSSNVYTTGFFEGVTDFDPGAGSFPLTPVGGKDIFVSKLDSSGDFVWAKQFGGTSDEQARSIFVDSSGNVFTAGFFEGTTDFDPNVLQEVLLVSGGGKDSFISKLNSSGDLAWVKQFSGAGTQAINSMAIDSNGNIYTAGFLVGGIGDFDPGVGSFPLDPAASTDMFISKLDSSGDFSWAKQIVGAGVPSFSYDSNYGIGVDSAGGVYTTGYFENTVDFDPGAGTANLTFTGGDDIFINKLKSNGDFDFVKQVSGPDPFGDYAYAYSLAIDSSNNIYTTGAFWGTVDFNPGAGSFPLTVPSGSDSFVSKLAAVDITNPTVSSLSPTDGATGVSASANLVITFDEAVNVQTGNVVIYKASDDSVFETVDITSGNVTGTGTNTITINPTGVFSSLTDYYVQVDATALDDLAGNSYAGIADNTTWNFTTGDSINPTVLTFSPADEAVGVVVGSNFVITFDEAVNVQSGNVTIYKASDDSVFEAIDVTSGNVTGTGTDTITINPTGELASLTSYYVQVDATAFDDLAGNSYVGIADNTTWNFTSEEIVVPPVDDNPGTTSGSSPRPKPVTPPVVEPSPTPTPPVSPATFPPVTPPPSQNKFLLIQYLPSQR